VSGPVCPGWLSDTVGGGAVTGLRRLLGGASQQMWAFELDGRPLVLRRTPLDGGRPARLQREAAVLRRAAVAGVRVPDVVAAGPEFLVMTWVQGEALARRILRDERFAGARGRLVSQCAQELARLHRIGTEELPELARLDPLEAMRAAVDEIGEPHPALELGFHWLAAHRPPAAPDTLVHGDFRLGNLMIDEDGLAAVLDWELAYIGDGTADLGWMCVRSWRFGASLPVAGVGSREELLAGYERAGGGHVSLESLHWWEVLGTLRWAVLCMVQARLHLEHGVRSVELAAIGRRVCEVELDLLDLLPGAAGVAGAPDPATAAGPSPAGLHDRPTAGELLAAVREFLAGLELTGHEKFLARVSGRALDIVARELDLGPGLTVAHAARLRELGMGSDAELAQAIRSGRLAAEAAGAPVRAAVVAKLRVADPRQLIDRQPTTQDPR